MLSTLFRRRRESTKWELAREILEGKRRLRHSLATDRDGEETKQRLEGLNDLREKLYTAYERDPQNTNHLFTPEEIELLLEI